MKNEKKFWLLHLLTSNFILYICNNEKDTMWGLDKGNGLFTSSFTL